jgi:hypothetical protein
VFTPWYWVAFDWACKVAAVGLAFVLLSAGLSVIASSASWKGDTPATLWKSILGNGLSFLFAFFVIGGTCRAIYFIWRSRADLVDEDNETHTGWVYVLFICFTAVLPFSLSASNWSDAPNYLPIAVTVAVVTASIRLTLSPLPIETIEIRLKDGAATNWTGLTEDQSTRAQKELAAAMSETEAQP